MFVDSHCHLDRIKLDDFDQKFQNLIDDTARSDIDHMLCVSIDLEAFPDMLEMIEPYDQISVSAGVHPSSDEGKSLDREKLMTLAEHDKVIAIGETGLDYFYNKGDLSWQQDRFADHIECAIELDKPVIVHTRDAARDTIDILRDNDAERCGGVIHCFTETMDFAREAMEMGFMISFSGIITFNNAAALREVAREVPDEHLLIETDAPYLAPMPHRGKQNWPGYVRRVAETLADIRETSVEHIADVTKQNFNRLFKTAIN